MRILVTGAAGFIGFHLVRRLIAEGHSVVGFDGMTNYYDPKLKEARLALLSVADGFRFHRGMLENLGALETAAADCDPEIIIHLAAQAGVRYSLESPASYISSNLDGTFNVMEIARQAKPRHFLFASTSSVYGGNTAMPFREAHAADRPLTIYAATKKANEAMTHSYAHLWKIPTTAFRFFTVYGPWGRPDMALFKFVKGILSGEPIDVYGGGNMRRDFTYIDDIVEGIVRLMAVPPCAGKPVLVDGVRDSLSPVAPWRVTNIAGGQPIGLLDFIETIEKALGRKAVQKMLPMQTGDVIETHADASLLKVLTGFTPATSVEEGVKAFVEWYREYSH